MVNIPNAANTLNVVYFQFTQWIQISGTGYCRELAEEDTRISIRKYLTNTGWWGKFEILKLYLEDKIHHFL